MRMRSDRIVSAARFLAILLACLTLGHAGELPTVHIGAIFEDGERDSESAFRSAVDLVNNDPAHSLTRFRLAGVIQRIPSHDAFHARKAACKLLSMGVMAIVGPSSGPGSAAVDAACKRSRVPHLVTRAPGSGISDGDASTDGDGGGDSSSISIRLSPRRAHLGSAIKGLLDAKGWKSFTLVYEDSLTILRLREVLRLSPTGDVTFRLRQCAPGEELRKVFREVGRRGESNILLDAPTHRVKEYLKQAQDVGMLTEYHNYITTSLDLHTLDLRSFYSSRCNVTGFRMVTTEESPSYLGQLDEKPISGIEDSLQLLSPRARQIFSNVKLGAAVAHDAVLSFARGLQTLSRSRNLEPKHDATCQPGRVAWPYGLSLATQVKAGTASGLTGRLQFDTFGSRTNLSFSLVQLKETGLLQVGTWDERSGVHYSKNQSEVYEEVAHTLRNKTLRVVTIVSEPYVLLRKDSKTSSAGEDRLDGYCVDILRQMALLLGFRFELRLVRDGTYGVVNARGEWSGIIREVMDREADLAIGDLTITVSRSRAVDFTLPFMHTGIGILYRRPVQESRLFYFLLPLSLDVWLCLLAAYLGSALMLHLAARMAPAEWHVPRHGPKCDCDRSSGADSPRNALGLGESLWYATAALLFQGCETSPRAASTRLIAISWWVFSLIMVSFYTANMAAFLVNEKLQFPIENVHDLAAQSKIKYGCMSSGSTETFFKESKLEPYERMWTVMSNNREDSLASSTAEGVERVRRGDYAFLMEAATIEYITDRDCQLAQIGGPLDSKGYGFALPRGSPYTAHLSEAILRLQETGVIARLKKQWWTGHCSQQREKERGASALSDVKDSSEEANALGVSNVGGVFLVLLGGLGVSSVCVILEFVWKTHPSSKAKKKALERSCDIMELSKKESKTSLEVLATAQQDRSISVLPATTLQVDVVDNREASAHAQQRRPDVS
ncbi:glutamate receptor ionotropic, kainate 2 [Rhipicephalus microplus]|uniref:glutamate receptor ionotropic, kainate 2 n=1 Tax=Rhipicephalus microplus TaxID=6941 RepID=UPI003F6C0F2A